MNLDLLQLRQSRVTAPTGFATLWLVAEMQKGGAAPLVAQIKNPPMTANLRTVEIKAFVPAHDFERSQLFYRALGFEIPWSGDGLAYVRFGATSFLLQAFDAPGFSNNFQMHLLVENVDDWHAQVLYANVAERFGVIVGALQDQPWAMRDFTLTDPSGVLWRVAQNIPQRSA